MNITEIIIALVSGGVISTLINLLISKSQRRKDSLTSHKETIEMLLDGYEELIKERTKLLRELSDKNAASTPHRPADRITLE